MVPCIWVQVHRIVLVPNPCFPRSRDGGVLSIRSPVLRHHTDRSLASPQYLTETLQGLGDNQFYSSIIY